MKTGLWSIIRRMFYSFWRRWWLINRLHRLCVKQGGVVWVEENEFINYLKTFLFDTSATGNHVPLRWPFSWIFESLDNEFIDAKIKNLIFECSETKDEINTIIRKNIEGSAVYHLRLTARGSDRYSWSNIIFGHEYAKNIWTGVIVAVVGWFLISQFQGVVSSKQNFPQSNVQQSNVINWHHHSRYYQKQ